MNRVNALLDEIVFFGKLGRHWAIPGMWRLWLIRHHGTGSLPEAKSVLGSRMLPFDEALQEALDCFACDAGENDRAALKKDIVRAAIQNHTTPAEYFIFGFSGLPGRERRQFVSRFEKNRYMNHYIRDERLVELLMNKYAFYQAFRRWFHRDMAEFEPNGSHDGFVSFCKRHSAYIAKNETGRMGVGTVIRRFAQSDAAIQGEIDYLSQSGDRWVVEELIDQDERMAALHPASVNTIRICARWTGTSAHIMEAFVRTGQGGAVVDNICSGGLSAAIDPESGAVISNAIDHLGKEFEIHPTTGIRFRGFEIPCWDALLETLNEVQAELPDYPYIGWDFALSATHGWVLVEGNWGNFITQYFKRGIRKEFMDCFRNKRPIK